MRQVVLGGECVTETPVETSHKKQATSIEQQENQRVPLIVLQDNHIVSEGKFFLIEDFELIHEKR